MARKVPPVITPAQVEAHLGEILTAKEIKVLFGYSPNTYISDTVLRKRGWLEWGFATKIPYHFKIVKGKPF